MNDPMDPTHAELMQQIFLEEASSRTNAKPLEATKAFLKSSILSAAMYGDSSLVGKARFATACDSIALMDASLPTAVDEPAKV